MLNRLFPALLLATASAAFAGEGMWMPQQVPQLAPELQKMGIKIDPNRFADLTGDPMGAVVSLGNCSASFVSPDGLVVTNHHCGYGAIQYNSTPKLDLPAGPGSRIFVTTKIEDVTARVVGSLDAKLSDVDRDKAIDRNVKQLVDECEKPGGVRCRVASFFEGAQYLRTTEMEIRDVRLVYAPALGVGDFGGETDNWMWPRHTGDFSFLRAYVGKDGKPADYSKDNVPYHSAHVLKVSMDGVNPGDPVIVAGYPGRTFRYRTALEVRNSKEFTYPTAVRYATDINAILREAGKNNRDVEIRNANRVRSNDNLLKNYQGTLAGFAKDRIVELRQKREADLAAYIAAHPEAKKYAGAVDKLNKLDEQAFATRERDLVLFWLYRSSPMLTQARDLYRLSIERPKKDLDRQVGFQERDWPRLAEASVKAQKSLEPGSDRAGLKYMLNEAEKLPANERINAIDAAVNAAGGIDKFLDQLYAGTKIGNAEQRKAMLSETEAQLAQRGDSFINFAAALTPLILQNEDRDRAFDGASSRVRPLYLEGLRAMTGGRLYPDANGTLRVTFGLVEGYAPRDAVWYNPKTGVSGVLQKDTGSGEFESPKPLLEAIRQQKFGPYADKHLREVPVNFLSTVDTTGGNSGSPTLNAKGELCGLLFDGNYEALGSDFLVDPAVTRSIHVDALYMLWVMDAVDGADNLLKEMGITPSL